MAVQHGARLLIVETRPPYVQLDGTADQFARHVAGAGGPAVLVVQAKDASARDTFLERTYAAFAHGENLSQLANPATNAEVTLYLGEGADRSLMLDRWMSQMQEELNQARLPSEHYLHAAQIDRLTPTLTTQIERARQMLTSIPPGPWNHERDGTIRLADASRRIARARASLRSRTRAAAQRAPRVLNANFGWGAQMGDAREQMLDAREPLVEGQDYHLCVDIGPSWQDRSIVTGNAEFPIAALAPGADGHRIEVVFSTSDFDPPISRADLWLPSGSGASSPMIEGRAQGSPPSGGKRRWRSRQRARAPLSLLREQPAAVGHGFRRTGYARRRGVGYE
jgi:hypothetical protein